MSSSAVGEAAESRGVVQSRVLEFGVVLSHLALVLVIYRHTLQLGFVSDAWVYLARLRAGVWTSIATPVGYHFQPVATAWIALIRACCGEDPAAFQAVNLLQLASLGYLTYQLGRRLLPRAGIAYLGSLLVVGNAAFYETSYWPLAGNMHLLSAQLYVLAVILAHDVGAGRLRGSGPWFLGLTVLAAIFSHPAMVTALPVCALTLFLARGTPGDSEQTVRKLKALLPLVVGASLFGLSRLAFGAEFESAPRPSFEPIRAYWLVTRGLVAVFTLRGSHDEIHRLMTFGTFADFASGKIWIYIWGWLAVAAVAGGICLWRARTPGLRVLVSFLGIHVLAAAIAGGMSSRQSHLPAVPAALLTAWALYVVAERLAALAPTALGVVCRLIPAVAVLLLIVGARADHQTATEVHLRAGNLSRGLVELIKVHAPPDGGPRKLSLINMPGSTIARNIGAFTFSNGLDELVRLTSPEIATLQLLQLSIPTAPPDFANGSVPVSVADVRTQLLDPSRVVLLYERPSSLRSLSAEDVDKLTAP